MSKNIESYQLKAEMRDDLMQCYREIAPHCITQHGAWRKTVLHPAKKYYITRKQACQILNAYYGGKKEVVLKLKNLHKEMYLSIIEKIDAMSQTPEYQGRPLYELVTIIINGPAPRFYISPAYMANIFSLTKHKLYDDDGRYVRQGKRPSEILAKTGYYNNKRKNK